MSAFKMVDVGNVMHALNVGENFWSNFTCVAFYATFSSDDFYAANDALKRKIKCKKIYSIFSA